jgi:hypothetical protein
MRSLDDVHGMNAYKTIMSVCLSVRMIQLKERWTDLDEIRHWHNAIGIHHKIVILIFLQSVIPT